MNQNIKKRFQVREMLNKSVFKKQKDYWDLKHEKDYLISKINKNREAIKIMEVTEIPYTFRGNKTDFFDLFDHFTRQKYENDFEEFLTANFKKNRRKNKNAKKRRNFEEMTRRQKFLKFFKIRTCNVPNIHVLYWLKLVDFNYVLFDFKWFIKWVGVKDFESQIRDFEENSYPMQGENYNEPNLEMLEFMNQTIFEENKKWEERRYGRHKSEIWAIEQELQKVKKMKIFEKLVGKSPLNQSLLEHVQYEKGIMLGNSCKSKKNKAFLQRIEEMIQNEDLQQDKVEDLVLKSKLKERWLVSEVVIKKLKRRYLKKIPGMIEQVGKLDIEMQNKENERIAKMLKKMDIVAMTTTGACKYRNQLHMVGAKIILIEEAAEILEAHIVTSLSVKTQQLILIGDHQQLKPKVNSFILGHRYGLSTSLFERFVLMGVPRVTLQQQRRMRPKISKILKLIYPNLQDHQSVRKYQPIR